MHVFLAKSKKAESKRWAVESVDRILVLLVHLLAPDLEHL